MKELILETLKIYDSDDLRWVENGVTVGFGFIPKDTKKRCLKKCPKCFSENYAMAVSSGQCAFCGWDANENYEQITKNGI